MPEQKCILHHLGASLQSVRVPWVKKIYEQILVTQLGRGETDCICCMSCTLSFFCLDDEGILHCNIQYRISIRKIPRWDYLETGMNPPFSPGDLLWCHGQSFITSKGLASLSRPFHTVGIIIKVPREIALLRTDSR